MMPYKDPAKQAEASKRWRQSNLFEVQKYEKERRPPRSDEYVQARYERRQREYISNRGGPRTFVGCDGEGMGDGSEHAYYVWRMGRNVLITGQPLKCEEIFEFILAQPQGPIYVIFSGNYDFTMMLKGAPNDFVSDLLNRDGRTDDNGKVRPARWNDIRVDYIPHKRLSIGRGSRTVVIHDVFGFFQSSFLVAIEEWDVGSSETRALVKSGKERRGSSDVLSEEEKAYNRIECDLLAEMVQKLDDATRSLGLSASPYEGAGAIASSLMKIHVAKPIKERNKRLPDAAKEPEHMPDPYELIPSWDAYYGGRFEITAHGPINRPVYEYDINSAYPAVIQYLPCLLHGRWVEGDNGRGIRLGHIRWNTVPKSRLVSELPPFGPLPHRNKQGNVTFPLVGSGWYWSVEWPDDPATYEVDACWSWIQQCEHKPFAWVRDRYQQRKTHKAAGRKGQAMMLKLGYNSLYGKMAQNVGQAPWRNSVYAGLVTSTCRKWLRNAAMQRPEDIVMFATDGIYSLSPLDLPINTELGGWEYGDYPDGLHFVRPGIYFSPDGKAKVKSRGISRATIERNSEAIIGAFGLIYDHPDWLTALNGAKLQQEWGIGLEFSGLVSIRLAYSQNRPEKAGYFGTLPHKMSYAIYPKRVPLDTEVFENNWRDGILRSAAPPVGYPAESVGYGRSGGVADDDVMDVLDSAPEKQGAIPLELF